MKIQSTTGSGFHLMPSPEKASAADTAADFEALLIGQMLKSARSDSDGWLGTGEDSSSASLIEMAEDQIAKVLADGGGLGLASMIERSLATQTKPPTNQADSSTVQISGKLR